MRARERCDAREHEMVLRRDLRLPALLDHDRLMGLDDDRGACHSVARRKRVAGEHARLVPDAGGKEPRLSCRSGQGGSGHFPLGLAEFRAAADRLDRQRLDHKLLVFVDESESRVVRRLEGFLDGVD